MGRRDREAKLKAMYKDRYPFMLMQEMGGRKRDRKKELTEEVRKSFQTGTVPTNVPWAGLTTWGAPQPLQGLMNVDQRQFANSPLANLSSFGPLGHMFAGSSGSMNPFDVSGTLLAGPPQAPQGPMVMGHRPDFYGLNTGGEVQAPVVQPQAPPRPQAPPPQRTPYRPPPPAQQPMGPPQGYVSSGPKGPGYMPAGDYGPNGTVTTTVRPRFGANTPQRQQVINRVRQALGMGRANFGTTVRTFKEGSVPDYAKSPMIDSSREGIPGWIHRKVMNSLPTLAGLGMALARGASLGPGPGDSILAEFSDPSQSIDPQTLGEVILARKRMAENPTIQKHELGHVAQGRYFGPLLPAAAGVASLVQQLRGKDPYLDSPFETSALQMGQEELNRGYGPSYLPPKGPAAGGR